MLGIQRRVSPLLFGLLWMSKVVAQTNEQHVDGLEDRCLTADLYDESVEYGVNRHISDHLLLLESSQSPHHDRPASPHHHQTLSRRARRKVAPLEVARTAGSPRSAPVL